MNAGAYGDSLSDIAVNVRYSDGEKILTRTVNECGFGYRTSLFEKMDRDGRTAVILGLTVKLDKETNKPVAENIKANGKTVERIFIADRPEDKKQEQAFKQSLVKL